MNSSIDDPDQATLAAAVSVLEALAGLMLARGIRYARAEELLKAAFVRAGARAFVAQGKPASVSTLSVASGLRRREVQRLVDDAPVETPPVHISLAARVRARWTSEAQYLDSHGQPLRLPRTAPADQPSFASLAAAISKDVHPRPMLDELVRVGAAEEDGDHVVLRGRLGTPDRSWDELVAVGCANVADHLSAVLVNLLTQPRPLFEQSLFADGLTQRSAQRGADLAKEMWLAAAPGMTNRLQSLVDLDEQTPDNGWRLRIGLYSYIAPVDQPAAPLRVRRRNVAGKAAPARTRKKKE
jgi:Family of unknown function (DUF6502)